MRILFTASLRQSARQLQHPFLVAQVLRMAAYRLTLLHFQVECLSEASHGERPQQTGQTSHFTTKLFSLHGTTVSWGSAPVEKILLPCCLTRDPGLIMCRKWLSGTKQSRGKAWLDRWRWDFLFFFAWQFPKNLICFHATQAFRTRMRHEAPSHEKNRKKILVSHAVHFRNMPKIRQNTLPSWHILTYFALYPCILAHYTVYACAGLRILAYFAPLVHFVAFIMNVE